MNSWQCALCIVSHTTQQDMWHVIVFVDAHYSPAADVTSAKQTDDDFVMFDEDISVKVPNNVVNMLQGFKGEIMCF